MLSPRQPNETRFAGFEEVASLDVSRRYHGPFDDSQVIFGPGLDNLVQWIEGAEDCGFNVPFDKVDKDRLTVRFHDPNLHAHDDDILSKPFALLGELCDVISPCRTGEKGQIYRLNPPGERWPSLQVVQGAQSNVPLHPGDILISRYRNMRAVLVDQPDKGVTPSDSFLVIRCKSDLISPEYLITYLHTKFAWSYAERNMTGVVIERISKRNLLALPVLLPGQEMLTRSRAIYEALFCKPEKEEDHFERIRRAKFEPVKLAETDLQFFYLQEIIGRLSKSKLRHLKEIVEDDIRELDTCREVRALKACLVLCGSVLEAVLLEWLSEIEEADYVQKNSSPGLAEIIDKLVAHGVLADPQDKNCHHIREKRNVVHPSKMLKRDPLSEGEVDEVITMLKEILHTVFD